MPAQPMLELRGAAMSFGRGAQAVHALAPTDLTVRSADYLAIMGRSGSGKSTLLNVMGLLITPSAGTVLVGGQDTSDFDDDEMSALRGAMLGFVFQSFHLLPSLSAQENVELPLVYARVPSARRHAMAASLIERVELSHRARALPAEMSGGERQRVAMARAIVREPSVLLCDEPTGNLDSNSARRVIALLDELNKSGMAVAIVTHDPDVAEHARRLLHLRDGVAEPAISEHNRRGP